MISFMGLLLIGGMCLAFFMMFVVWIISLIIKNAGVVDVAWGLGFVILAAFYSVLPLGDIFRKAAMVLMVALWGLRLSWSILRRLLHEQKEDRRYQALRESWKIHLPLKFFFFFEFQAFLQLLLSIPFLLICLNERAGISVLEIIGIAIWLTAFIGEVISDEQLRQFKINPQNKGKTCQVGLWYYSRHPNYFFEWMIWVGYFIFALSSPYGWVSIISPIIMLHFLLNVSGVPLAEAQSLKSRGEEYREYQRTTSVFVPLPKRK